MEISSFIEYQPIIPFCIYHYIDESTKTYMGFIDISIITKHKDGSISYSCPQFKKSYGIAWKNVGMFYAVNPLFRPIPWGMKLYCANCSDQYPYNVKDIEIVYDPYNIKPTCNYFITYNQPTLNTSPLYFHRIGSNIFPSFDKDFPTKDIRWTQSEVPTVYVMTPSSLGKTKDIFDTSNILFSCFNRKCTPYTKEIRNVYNISLNTDDIFDIALIKEPTTLDKCVVSCNEMIVHDTSGEPSNLIKHVVGQNLLSRRSLPNIFNDMNIFIVSVSVAVFVGLLLVIIKKINKI